MKNVLEQRVRNMGDAVVTLPASRNLTVIASNLSRTSLSLRISINSSVSFFCYLDTVGFGSFITRIFKICKILRRLVQRVTLTRLLQKSEQLNVTRYLVVYSGIKNDKIAERMVEANSFFRWGAANRVRA